MKIYFTDFFEVSPTILEKHGAFNISLINDLPLFIDPFLLFGSEKKKYQKLHKNILKYLTFLKVKAENDRNSSPQIKSWYLFPEVKQNWFGYCLNGNSGRGLGVKFGKALSSSIQYVFDDIGQEKVTQTSHLEKAGLFQIGVGKDNISDFTTNLIKEYLLKYTQKFAMKNIDERFLRKKSIEKVFFDYKLERWMPKEFVLPYYNDDFVLLTPKNILTKDNSWINNNDLRADFDRICNSIPNDQLKSEIFNYFRKMLPATEQNKSNTQKEITKAIFETINKYPDIVKYYIKSKEKNKQGAKNYSSQKVKDVESLFIENITSVVNSLLEETKFYDIEPDSSFKESMKRIEYLKDVIENKDGYRLFYVNGNPLKREDDLQIIYKLTWYATSYDVNRETNNGRGPADYVVSNGANDKTIIEFKLAKNTQLKDNLAKQVAIYEKANNTKNSIKVILYFNLKEFNRVSKILKELGMEKSPNIVLIDAEKKISASKVKIKK